MSALCWAFPGNSWPANLTGLSQKLCCYFKGSVEGKQINKSKIIVSKKEGQGRLKQLLCTSWDAAMSVGLRCA